MSHKKLAQNTVLISFVVVLFLGLRGLEYSMDPPLYPALVLYFGFILFAYSFGLYLPDKLSDAFLEDDSTPRQFSNTGDTRQVTEADIESIDTPASGPTHTVADTAPESPDTPTDLPDDTFGRDDTIKDSPPIHDASLAFADTKDTDTPSNEDASQQSPKPSENRAFDNPTTTKEADPDTYDDLKQKASDSDA